MTSLEPARRCVLQDWSSRADTSRSPSAGWGVPANAISFERLGSEPAAAASIRLTLASTGIGSGFDVVGHAPGTYVNRVDVTPLR